MATHKSALKRNRQSKIRNERNRALRSKVKTAVAKFIDKTSSDNEMAGDELKKTISVISKSATKGIMPKRTASRKISRLSKLYNKSLD